jgi:hypothetical protein
VVLTIAVFKLSCRCRYGRSLMIISCFFAVSTQHLVFNYFGVNFSLFGGKIFIFTKFISFIHFSHLLNCESYSDATFNNNLCREYIKAFCNRLVTIENFIYYKKEVNINRLIIGGKYHGNE